MAKFTKSILISALVFFLLGLSVFIYAGVSGGMRQAWNISARHLMEFPFINNSAWGIRMNENGDFSIGLFDHDGTYIKGNGEIVVVDSETPIKNIDLNIGFGDVEIVTTNDEKASYSIDGYVGETKVYVTDDATLVFDSKTAGKKFNFTAGDIVIYIPESAVRGKCDIELGAGDLDIKELNGFNQVSIEVGAGACDINKINTSDLDIECGAGDIQIDSLDAKRVDIECACGNIELQLAGAKEDYNYYITAALGNIEIGNDSYTGIDRQVEVKNNANKSINIDCALGNVEIDCE